MKVLTEGEAGLVTVRAVHFEEKEAEVTTELGNLETRMVKVETTLNSSNNFQVVRNSMMPKDGKKRKVRGQRPETSFRFSKTKWRSLASLSLGTLWSGILTLSLAVGTESRMRLRYPWNKLEDMIHKVQDIVRETAEDSLVALQVGTNDAV